MISVRIEVTITKLIIIPQCFSRNKIKFESDMKFFVFFFNEKCDVTALIVPMSWLNFFWS